MNYEFNLLHHVGVVAKRVYAAAETAASEGDNNDTFLLNSLQPNIISAPQFL